jgi:phosphatidylserine/phosphatidylglycerophosphate/cardiolipin synthase-like enzyme
VNDRRPARPARRPSLPLAAVALAALLAGCSTGTPTGIPTTRAAAPGTTGAPHGATTAGKGPTATTGAPTTTAPAAPTTTAPAAPTTTAPAAPTTTAPGPGFSLITEPTAGTGPIYSLMSSATHTLDMTMYELSDPQAESILEADAHRGVAVRVILDKEYSGGSVNAAAYSALSANGVQVHWAPASTIFHQKTITVDDATSLIMTLNLTSQYYATTRDFAVATTTRTDVHAIEQVFDTDWGSGTATPGPGPTGANLVWSPGAEQPILGVITSAQHTLAVENEEMDDPAVIGALVSAAGRGVDVKVTMTYTSSWKGELGQLAGGGVHVHVYESQSPLYIHAKAIVADGTTAFIGSQNFSEASLDYNRELGLITSDPAIVGSVTATLTSDFDGATAYGT